mmetsp:Transcript_8123/g.23871  ORF Transcript_8123/g.23871 Transcript_8123/m.23871 type:complete len:192 (-) Transcript_8123:156-731(-)
MGLFTLLLPLLFILTQSPLAFAPSGGAISPLQVIATTLRENQDQPLGDSAKTALRAVLFPGNLLRAALSSAPVVADGPPLDTADLWERSLELATARTSAYKSFDHQELLAAGSWCVVFGCVLSLVLRRPHVLLLFGIAMLGAFFALNGLMPTVQFALCLALPVTDLSRALTQPQPAVAAAGPAAAARPKRD